MLNSKRILVKILALIILNINWVHSQVNTEQKTLIDSQQIHKDFEALDRDGDGYLTAHDLRLSIPGIEEDDITTFFDKFDGDRDGVLTFEEYLSIVTESSKGKDQNKQNDLNNQNKANPEY